MVVYTHRVAPVAGRLHSQSNARDASGVRRRPTVTSLPADGARPPPRRDRRSARARPRNGQPVAGVRAGARGLEARRDVIAPDLPGFGDSPPLPAAASAHAASVRGGRRRAAGPGSGCATAHVAGFCARRRRRLRAGPARARALGHRDLPIGFWTEREAALLPRVAANRTRAGAANASRGRAATGQRDRPHAARVASSSGARGGEPTPEDAAGHAEFRAVPRLRGRRYATPLRVDYRWTEPPSTCR